jgi:hypothetical protein
MPYEHLEDARKALLCDAVSIAQSSGEPFAVVGGWSPLLLNSHPIKHPGTKDVDLLFAHGVSPGQLQRACNLFLSAGYYPSAKHPFQLIRIMKVASQELAFNIDLLHPCEQSALDFFVDHIELPVPMTSFYDANLAMKSVAVPASRFIFEYNRIARVQVLSVSESGSTSAVEVPVIDEAGLIVTKSHSFRNVKRRRDLFDIYLAVTQCRDRSETTTFLRRLKTKDADTFNTLHEIEDTIIREPELLERINEHLSAKDRIPASELQKALIEFLREAGADPVQNTDYRSLLRIE